MKKHFFVFLTVLTAVMVSSCKKDNDELDNPNNPNNFKGPWDIELQVDCSRSIQIELAGTGTATIDWGDGMLSEDFRMPELKKQQSEDDDEENREYEGITYSHTYDKAGTYIVKIAGEDGAIALLSLSHFCCISLILDHCSCLQYLDCSWNKLTSLDVSKCTQLKELYCIGNELTSLDVSKNTQLKWLECDQNELTSLNVSGCTQLQYLDCGANELTSLDVSKCPQLKELGCTSNNQLTSLNISGCTQLKRLVCLGNRLPVEAMNKIYNDLPVVAQGEGKIEVDRATPGDYRIAEEKGWRVVFW